MGAADLPRISGAQSPRPLEEEKEMD